MRSTERAEFTTLLDALCAGFNQANSPERIDAYWRGLANMALPAFERVVDHALGEKGPEKLPTAPQVWRLHRSITASSRVQAQPPTQGTLAPHEFELHANRVMLRFLREKALPFGVAASPASLAAMLAAKRRLVEAYQIIVMDEPAACAELRDALLVEFQQLFVPASAGDYSYPLRGAS